MDIQLTEQMNVLFENAPIGIGLTTIDGKALEANEALLGMLGYSKGEFLRRNLTEFYANPEQRSKLLENLSESEAVNDFGVKLKRKDGSQFYASLNVSKIDLEGQEVMLSMIEDVTEHVQLNDQLRREIAEREIIEGGTHTFGIRHPVEGVTPEFEIVVDLTEIFFDKNLSSI